MLMILEQKYSVALALHDLARQMPHDAPSVEIVGDLPKYKFDEMLTQLMEFTLPRLE